MTRRPLFNIINVLRIFIIVLGGLFVAEEIPSFVRQCIYFYQYNHTARWNANPTLGALIASGLEIVIGILLMTEQRRIVRFILSWQSQK